MLWIRGAVLGLLSFICGCGFVSFGRRMSADEVGLRQEVKAYYSSVQAAFAAGSPEALGTLFDGAIRKPMTHQQIEDWGKDFFGKHGPATFRIEKLEIESLGLGQAVVVLTYQVVTKDHAGDFGGVERDWLAKEKGRWRITAWENVDPEKEKPDTILNQRR